MRTIYTTKDKIKGLPNAPGMVLLEMDAAEQRYMNEAINFMKAIHSLNDEQIYMKPFMIDGNEVFYVVLPKSIAAFHLAGAFVEIKNKYENNKHN